MTILFSGGPCDGSQLAPIEIQKVALLRSIPTRRGLRKFGLFPPLRDWPSVAAGMLEVDPAKTFIYEMVNTIHGPQYQYDPGGRRYREAAAEAL